MKTTLANPKDTKKWYIVDATDLVLGRLAVKIANILRGRHKAIYTPHIDAGDNVIVINADKVKLTGNKEQNKKYMFYTGWVGNEYYRSVADFRKSSDPRRNRRSSSPSSKPRKPRKLE